LRIRDHLRGFPNVELDTRDYEEAARGSNRCRGHGIAGSPIDLLMCAAALRYGWQIFTTDRDFARYSKVLNIRSYSGVWGVFRSSVFRGVFLAPVLSRSSRV
jgi:predicted nucleic acid-binding protein